MAGYMAVTPLGKMGYVLSRLIFPAVIAFFISVFITYYSTLTDWNLFRLSAVSLLMSLSSMAAALFIFSFSRNKVEGMAMGKLVSLMFSGLVVPFFVKSGTQYLSAFLPSFWAAKLSIGGNILLVLPGLVVSFTWIWITGRRFIRKLY
jgi:fluoroquinolone transport system permease protein